MRVSDLIGQVAHDRGGAYLGRIVDVLAHTQPDGNLELYAVLISRRRRLRLLGYERPETTGPRVIAQLAKALQGPLQEIPITAITLPGATGRR